MQDSITELPNRVFLKWNNYFKNELNIDTWIQSFQNIYQNTQFIELQHFHFKMMHQTLANNEDLYNWKLTDTNLCSFCHEQIETLCHIYLECEVTKHIWTELEDYIALHLDIRMHLNKKTNYVWLYRKGNGSYKCYLSFG